MISDEELDKFRQEDVRIRVERDSEPANDVRGLVVAWDGESVLLRKINRKLVKLSRSYRYRPDAEPREPGPAAD